MKVKSEREVAQSCPTLCDPMDCSLPGSSFHGIFQARVLEWGAIAFSIKLLRLQKKKKNVSFTQKLNSHQKWITNAVLPKSDRNYTTPESFQAIVLWVPGYKERCTQLINKEEILEGQARKLEWVAIFFSKGSSQPRDRTLHCRLILYRLSHQEANKKWKSLSSIQLFATPWTVAGQASLSMQFSRQEYWIGLPFHSPGDFPDPGIRTQISCIAGRFFTIWATKE